MIAKQGFKPSKAAHGEGGTGEQLLRVDAAWPGPYFPWNPSLRALGRFKGRLGGAAVGLLPLFL